ncbi:putative serine/threonine-protein kinase mps1 isoform X1 [Cinnamomum micranthum f. kanehirae]|uniref:Putative serine/threonine-protein kinase mps1 isoform X1 n=1 Tax=Cinnamomum micranthum f. kanehirae TaxID=337451 RepID=A0A443PHE3_9MAGN|nr:putative serine/threonine-protein kinase mps1 isoform X1 [Cinnamomum micranthum f. kanehirae]
MDTASSKKLPHTSTLHSSPPSDFLRHIQAAFKRQRPIGSLPSTAFRARRILVPQKDPNKSNCTDTSKNGRFLEESSVEVLNLDRKAGTADVEAVGPGDSTLTAPSITATETITHDDFDFQGDEGRPVVNCRRVSMASISDCRNELVDSMIGLEKMQLPSVRNGSSAAAEPPSQRASDPMATVTRMDDLSSHMNYLALTENGYRMSDRVGSSTVNDQGLKQLNYQHTGVSDITMKSSVTCLSTKTSAPVHDHDFLDFFRKDVVQPTTKSLVAGSSCMSTTSVHSLSAPMLNSTTYNQCSHRDSHSHLDTGPLNDFSLNLQPIIQGYAAPTSSPSFQGIHIASGRQTAVSTQVSSSAPDTSIEVPDLSLFKVSGSVKKESDGSPDRLVGHKKDAHFDEKMAKEKGISGDGSDLQPHDPPRKNLNVNTEPSQSSKPEKTSSGRGMSAARKKNYDPDVFFKVNGKLYQKLGKIGSGGSSEVHKVIASDCTIYALKSIKLKGRDYTTAYGFCQEIKYLNKLKGERNIIQLIDYEVTDKTILEEVMNGTMTIKDGRIKNNGYIYMILEYGEIDLAHMLSQQWKEMDGSNRKMDENWLRFYWQQMLQAVNTIHEERIVHSDLKPANFLLVRGSLKLIDFGIAKAIMNDTTNIQREAQVGTLNYMSPEALAWNEQDENGNTIKCGRPSDIWSLGCILYQMVYGRTPFAEYKTLWARVKAITDPNHEITYDSVSNPSLLDLMKKCLAREHKERWRIPQLLHHPFLVPPTPYQLSPRVQHCKLLLQMSEVYKDVPQLSRLCLQLQQLLANPGPGVPSV